MKKNSFFILLTIALVAFLGVSCNTTGAKVEEDRAKEARQRAIDFEVPAYFPSEWETLETLYEAANSAAEYSIAADAYDELFKKTVPLYAQAIEDEILAAREQLIHTGFTEVFPEYLKKADDLALAAKEQYDAEDYYKARDTAFEALEEYETLEMGANVFLARQEIIDRGFTQYDADNFTRADSVAQTAIEAYEKGDKEGALAGAEEALLRYNIVLSNGWTVYARERRTAAVSERELAVSERANIASRDTFREGEAIFGRAEENFRAENFNVAGITFVEAEAIYAISRKETEERRVRAEEAIRLAGEKIEESSGAAQEAERLIEGGVR
ncbi:MAG: hypothetical protein FWD28_06335 [Treponema sp.]|nr:hypothetical protein [Treponema sp.]